MFFSNTPQTAMKITEDDDNQAVHWKSHIILVNRILRLSRTIKNYEIARRGWMVQTSSY